MSTCELVFIKSTYSLIFKAAHCIHPKNTSTRLLPRDILALFGAYDQFEQYQLAPDQIVIHDDWNPWRAEYSGDLSLLKFEKGKIRLNSVVEPICLWEPEKESWDKMLVARSNGNFGGIHGAVAITTFPLIPLPLEHCVEGSSVQAEIRTFCGTAGGDSGGGVFIIENYFQLAGVESRSVSCKDSDLAEDVIYTNVTEFKDWIEKIAKPLAELNPGSGVQG